MTTKIQTQETRRETGELNADSAIKVLELNGYSRRNGSISRNGFRFAEYVRGWEEFQVFVDYDKYKASKQSPEFSCEFLGNARELADLRDLENITFKVICRENTLEEVRQEFGKDVITV